MNNTQKFAWFALVATLTLVCLHTAAFILIFQTGYIPKTLNSIGLFVAVPLLVVMVLLFSLKKKDKVPYDERDLQLSRRVIVVDYVLLWLLLIAGCVGGLLTIGSEGTVKIYVLCALLYGAFLLTAIVHSLATIIMYGGRVKGHPLG